MIGLFSSLSSNRSRMKLVASDVAAVPVAALLLWGLFRDMGGFGPPGVWALILLPLAMWGVAQLSFLLMFLQRGCWTDTVHRLVLTTLSSLLSVLGLFSADMPVPGDLVALVAMTFFATATALHAIMRLALPHMSAPGHSGKAAPAKASKAPHALLGRAEIGMSHSADFKSYADRVVLVSGAGGSIGSELVRQILPCRPRKIVLFELNETALYDIHRTIKAAASGTNTLVVPVLGSVADPGKVRRTLRTHQVQVVLHAAAYKHVPLVEENPLAGLSNNVVGTQTLVDEAVAAQVERFVLISSDKAVRPINVMGASKRLCELVIQDAVRKHAGATGPVFATVRFGNVLGSSGSVLPLFEEQVRAGGPVTVTDPDVSRYFMTVQEAVHLVLHAGAMACGGEVFVLDMG
ncbi:MAG: polysaccharide biosynthesis protein, partial [Pseudomonadota bacterium]